MSLLIDAGWPASCSGAMYCGVPASVGVAVAADRRDAEVGDADVAVAVDHHVGRLQIAMQHAALVRRGDAGAQLARELDRLVLRDAADPAEQRREILAVDVLHRQEAAAVGVAEVVQPADVLVRHLARDAQLVVELRELRVVGRDAFGQELQGDRLIERQVVGAIHLAHAAAAEQRDQPVAAGDDRAGCQAAGEPCCRRSVRGRRSDGDVGVRPRRRPWRACPDRHGTGFYRRFQSPRRKPGPGVGAGVRCRSSRAGGHRAGTSSRRLSSGAVRHESFLSRLSE